MLNQLQQFLHMPINISDRKSASFSYYSNMEKRFLIDRKYIWLFPVAIVIGSVFTNIAGYDAVSKWDIFSEPVVNRIINADNTFAEIVGYVATKRIRLFIIVFLISISPFGNRMPYVICSYLGFGMGIILSALAMQYGARYLIIFLLAILCHMMLYVVGIYGIFITSWSKDIQTVLRYGLAAVIFAAGIMIESVMNYYVLPKFLMKI